MRGPLPKRLSLLKNRDFAAGVDKRRGARDQQTASFNGTGMCSRRLVHADAGFAWS